MHALPIIEEIPTEENKNPVIERQDWQKECGRRRAEGNELGGPHSRGESEAVEPSAPKGPRMEVRGGGGMRTLMVFLSVIQTLPRPQQLLP